MSGQVRVFVNDRPASVAVDSTIADVIASLDPEAAAAIASGTAYLTDGVGRPIDGSDSVRPGSIIRVVRAAPRRPPRQDAE